MSDSLLLRPSEAAAALGIGRSTLYVLLAAGELPVVRIGRCVRIPRQAIELWVAAKLATAEGEEAGGS